MRLKKLKKQLWKDCVYFMCLGEEMKQAIKEAKIREEITEVDQIVEEEE